jgi:hypothetical protein
LLLDLGIMVGAVGLGMVCWVLARMKANRGSSIVHTPSPSQPNTVRNPELEDDEDE